MSVLLLSVSFLKIGILIWEDCNRLQQLPFQVRNLKFLAPFSTLANAVTIISFAIICYFLFREPIVLDNRRTDGPINEFPFFFGTVLFSLEAIGMIMPLENEMRKPKDFVGVTGVLNRAFLVIVFLYIGKQLFIESWIWFEWVPTHIFE